MFWDQEKPVHCFLLVMVVVGFCFLGILSWCRAKLYSTTRKSFVFKVIFQHREWIEFYLLSVFTMIHLMRLFPLCTGGILISHGFYVTAWNSEPWRATSNGIIKMIVNMPLMADVSFFFCWYTFKLFGKIKQTEF